jgi:hypothetical protein
MKPGHKMPSHPEGTKHMRANGGNSIATPRPLRNVQGKNGHAPSGVDRVPGDVGKRGINGRR